MVLPEYIIPGLCFVSVMIGTYALLTLLDPYQLRVRSRVQQLQAVASKQSAPSVGDAGPVALPSRLVDWLHHLGLQKKDDRSLLQQRLAKAGIYHPAATSRYFIARLVSTIVAAAATIGVGLAGHLRMDLAVLAACLTGAFGAILPSLWLDRAILRHHIQLRRSLPDFLDVMTVCLEGGLSLQETIRRVSDELRLAHPALATELGMVQRDIELGATVEHALKRFAVRSDYEGVRTLSTFIREAQRFGTNITEALKSHADMLRSQREQIAEENAQKAAVKILLPTLLLIFPAIFVVAVGPALIQIQEAFAAK